MTAPRQMDSTSDPGAKTDALSQYQADFGVHMVHKGINFSTVLDDHSQPTDNSSRPQLASPPTGLTTSAKIGAEGKLLASIPSNIGEGIVDSAKDAWQHFGRTTFETSTGLVLGAGFCLLCKNPNPIVQAATTWAGRAFLGIAALDLGSRFAKPMSDTWAHPERLNQDKKVLGANLGDAVFNYSLAIGGGISGAKLGEKYLATTKLGTILQGFKETEISAEALGKLLADPSANQPLATMARAFVRRGVNLDAAAASTGAPGDVPESLPISGSMRLRQMPDGSHIGSTSDGSVMVLTRDGTALHFKNQSSLFGLRNKLGLAKVLHQGGDETDVLTGMYSPTTMGTYGRPARSVDTSMDSAPGSHPNQSSQGGPHIIGRDPSVYFDTPEPGGPSGGAGASVLGREPHSTYTTIDGTRFVTGKAGSISAVETGGNRLFLDAKGRWNLGLSDGNPKTTDFLGVDLSPASFNLGSITDRLDTLKKGTEVGMTEIMLERAGDIGSSVFEHEVLIHGTKAVEDGAPKHPI